MTLESTRAAARPQRRHTPSPRLISLLCIRCGRLYRTATLSSQCFLCERAAVKAFGSLHPVMEMGE